MFIFVKYILNNNNNISLIHFRIICIGKLRVILNPSYIITTKFTSKSTIK